MDRNKRTPKYGIKIMSDFLEQHYGRSQSNVTLTPCRLLVFRGALLFLAVANVVIITFLLYSKANYTPPTDCEIARTWYEISTNPVDTFKIFLENRFRSFGIIDSGGLFSYPRYNVAIRYPDRNKFRIKSYRFFVSRDGAFSSQLSISISQEEWGRGRRITCESIHGEKLFDKK